VAKGCMFSPNFLKYRIISVLEIGAFNGDGSTQVIAEALSKKKGDVSLISLEYNYDRYQELVKNTKTITFVTPINESSIGTNSFTPRDFDIDVWNTPFNGLANRFPKELVRKWYESDIKMIDLVQVGYLERAEIKWDAVLIDGGEFAGYDEYRLVKEKTNCIMLDDSFHAYKTFRARIELLKDPNWKLEWKDSKVRHGAAIFVRNNLKKESILKRIYQYKP
jgi:hypothetical protein